MENIFRKITFFSLLFLVLSFSAFSQENIEEQWLTIGAEFGNYFENESSRGFTYLGSPGFNINLYTFPKEKNIGMFFHFSFLFPAIEKNEKTDFDYLVQYDMIVGSGFRYNISEKSKLHFGIGLEFMTPFDIKYKENSTDYYIYNTNLGLGGDAGLKFDLTENIYIDVGLSFTYSFINFSTLYSFSNDKKIRTTLSDNWTMKYTMVGIKPYIGIGFNYYRGETILGKPK